MQISTVHQKNACSCYSIKLRVSTQIGYKTSSIGSHEQLLTKGLHFTLSTPTLSPLLGLFSPSSFCEKTNYTRQRNIINYKLVHHSIPDFESPFIFYIYQFVKQLQCTNQWKYTGGLRLTSLNDRQSEDLSPRRFLSL